MRRFRYTGLGLEDPNHPNPLAYWRPYPRAWHQENLFRGYRVQGGVTSKPCFANVSNASRKGGRYLIVLGGRSFATAHYGASLRRPHNDVCAEGGPGVGTNPAAAPKIGGSGPP